MKEAHINGLELEVDERRSHVVFIGRYSMATFLNDVRCFLLDMDGLDVEMVPRKKTGPTVK